MIEVITIRAEKGGTLPRQSQSLEKAKKDLSDLLNSDSVVRVINVSTVETDDETQFVATVEKKGE